MEVYHLDKSNFTPKSMVEDVQNDFQFKERAVYNNYKSGLFDVILKDRQHAILPSDYSFFIISDSIAVLWNTNTINLPDDLRFNPGQFRAGKIAALKNGFYYIQSWPVKTGHPDSADYFAVSIIPIASQFPLENQYFKSGFVANENIPRGTEISDTPVTGAIPVFNLNNKPVFYLNFEQTTDEFFVANGWTWFVAILLCLFVVFWLHELCYGIGVKTQNPMLGFCALLIVVVPVSFLLKYIEYPGGFQNSTIFSPELYYPSEGIKSLGNFLISMLLQSWLFIYLVSYVPLKENISGLNKTIEKTLRLCFAVLILVFLYKYSISDISNLIIDSKISFETGNFFNLNFYTFVGIFTIAVITINFLVLLAIINKLLQGVVKQWYWKMLLLAGIALIVMYCLFGKEFKSLYVAVLIMTLLAFLLLSRFGLPLKKRKSYYDLSIATSTYVWFAILCSWVTIEIFYFNYSKELELRKLFARKQEQKDDGNTAFKFIGVMDDLQKDSLVCSYFADMQNKDKKDNVSNYINYVYLTDFFKKFNIDIYFYDKNRNPVLRKDTIDAIINRYSDSVSQTKFKDGLLDVESLAGGDFIYWYLSPYKFNNSDDTLGYIGFVISADKRYKRGDLRSFFDVNSNPTDRQYYDHYSYAIYHDKNLWTQYGDVVFPYHLSDTLNSNNARFIEGNQYNSVLLFPSARKEIIKVVYQRNIFTNIVSLFSYVLALLLLVSGSVFLIRYFIFYPGRIRSIYRNFTFTIRSKINITILVTVFLSLFIVGFITLSFLSNRYDDAQKKNLQGLLNSYSYYIRHYIEDNAVNLSKMKKPVLAPTYSDFSYSMNQLAQEQGADVNIYNINGRLIASSQLDLYKKGLLSRYMDRSVLLSMEQHNSNELLRTENIGKLHYQSIYAPLRDKNNQVVAYINIPYYASGKDFENEISNVIITLINVYTLVFFLSGLCAIFISNSIVRSFRLLIDQFRNIRLRHNEYIQWPYRDEIALLVNEYNSMMRKVETMATRLARTEREAAWRDIARQVAHEIKNPLTPMKLNIQYLQQAISANRPDIDKLAAKVAGVLIEQIENLNIIASEFSNFAKMPDAFAENISLHEALQTLVDLFQKNNDNIRLELTSTDKSLMVYIDKSYFIRIFTNLLQNAIQSIDEDKQGYIKVSYEQNDGNIVIIIEDNGGGIPKELQDKLFQPYFTTKSSGTGLGLPMTKNLIENSDGAIWFITKEDEGSQFFVRLPKGEPD
ncbi:sensor histidine kinase [Taibaiella lutea]|nr:ATP-binding protein [Taibaiella lutea]